MYLSSIETNKNYFAVLTMSLDIYDSKFYCLAGARNCIVTIRVLLRIDPTSPTAVLSWMLYLLATNRERLPSRITVTY